MSTDPKEINEVQQKYTKETKRFRAFISYYRKYIPNNAEILKEKCGRTTQPKTK